MHRESPSANFRDAPWLALAEELLEHLRGRVRLMQSSEERYRLAAVALERLYRQPSPGRLPAFPTDDVRRQFLQDFLAYDLIEELLADPATEDIVINATNPIFVHRTGEGLRKTEKRFATRQELAVFVKKLLVFGGRTEAEPIANLELSNIRGRVNIADSPFGPQITITRTRPRPFTILELIERDMLTDELAAQLWLYVEGLKVRPANLLVAGGPSSGKTTLLNALLSFIPAHERVVAIEDTLELNTAFLEHCARLESGRQMELEALVKNSLRMRPERIVVAEVRGAEARDLMTAINIGKYCLGTVHASTARETVLRLQNAPMNVPPVLVNMIDVFVILRKLNREGRIARVVYELVETAGMERQVVLLSEVWGYDHERRRSVETSPSSTYRDHLAEESGRSPPEIIAETARRAAVLRRMQACGRFADILAVTQFCQRYSDDPTAAWQELGLTTPDEKRGAARSARGAPSNRLS